MWRPDDGGHQPLRRVRLSPQDPLQLRSPYHEPRYREYEDLEEVSRLWHERPDRWRQETDLSDGSGTKYRVADGKGPWWAYSPPNRALHAPTNEPREFSPDGTLSGLLDPYELRYDELRYRIRATGARNFGGGRTGDVVRETLEVEAEAISWDYAPLEPFREGADDYLLSVDAEVGVILRLASRLRSEEFEVFEMVDVAFDEAFAEGTFRLELPGVEFERVDR